MSIVAVAFTFMAVAIVTFSDNIDWSQSGKIFYLLFMFEFNE